MSEFRYAAIDNTGHFVSGTVSASSAAEARARLEAQGLQISELDVRTELDELTTGNEGTPLELSEADFVAVAHRVSDVTQTRLPLAPGLRALAEEAPSRRLSRSLQRISEQLEAGESLPEAMAQSGGSVPAHLRGLLNAALRTGDLGLVLQQYLTFARTASDLHRRVWMSFVYPLILLLGLGAIVTFFFYLVIPEFKSIFDDFGTELPILTQILITVSDFMNEYGLWILGGIALGAVLLWQFLGVGVGRALRSRIIANLPMIGPMFQFESLAHFCYLLSILVEHRVGLPEALRMAGAASRDANLRWGCSILADEVEHGGRLSDAAATVPHIPAVLVHVFRWERRQDAFADALRAAGERFAARAKLQTGLVGVVFEPILIVGMAVSIGAIVIALFMPLIKLLNDLS